MPLNKTDYESARSGVVAAVYRGVLEGNLSAFSDAGTNIYVEFNQEELAYPYGRKEPDSDYERYALENYPPEDATRRYYEDQARQRDFRPHILPFLIIDRPELISDNLLNEVINRINQNILNVVCIYPLLEGRITAEQQIDWRSSLVWLEEDKGD